MSTVYQRFGFADRKAYLASLQEDFPEVLIYMLADLLGPTEDFDGLISAIQDAEDCM